MGELVDYYDPNGLSAPFYDLVASRDGSLTGEVDFYAGLVDVPAWFLELGCGTGRITFPLAERGYAVVGLDNSAPMLRQAAAKHQQLDSELQARTALVQGDMTRFELNHQFDAAIAPFFAFSHLQPGTTRRSALGCIARHLQIGGVAALHTVHPAQVAAPPVTTPETPAMDVAFDQAGRRLKLFVRSQTFDEAAARFEQILDYAVTGADGREERRTSERLVYYVSDLEAEAVGSGLVLERKISPYNGVGEMWIFRRKS